MDINEKKLSKNIDKKKQKYKEIASGGVVFHKDSDQTVRFLLLKHKGKKKHWDLPKGHLEKKETLQEGAIREVIEETGIPKEELVLMEELNHKNIYNKKSKLKRKHKKIVHLFLFQSLTLEIKLSKEHTDYKWVKYEKLEKKLTYPGTTMPAFVEALKIIENL